MIDLSKVLDCIPYDLLIVDLHTYAFIEDNLVYFYPYLKRRQQNVTLNNTNSALNILLSGVLQGSVLGPILFNIFMNSLLLSIKNSDLHNFADDNTISSAAHNIEELTKPFIFYRRLV